MAKRACGGPKNRRICSLKLMHNPLIYLALCWIIFCVLHSVLISLPMATWLQTIAARLGALRAADLQCHRPDHFNSPGLFWADHYRCSDLCMERLATMGSGGIGLMGAASLLGRLPPVRHLPLFRPAAVAGKKGTHQSQGNKPLVMDGVLKIVRHPWYSGGIAIIWARDVTAAVLVTNVILTLYFIVGAFLEERRLVRQYGALYQRYQSKVDMFLPWRWFLQRPNRP